LRGPTTRHMKLRMVMALVKFFPVGEWGWFSKGSEREKVRLNRTWKIIGRRYKDRYPSYFSSEPSIGEFFRKGWEVLGPSRDDPGEVIWQTSTFESDSEMPNDMRQGLALVLKGWARAAFKDDSIKVSCSELHGSDTNYKNVYRCYLQQ